MSAGVWGKHRQNVNWTKVSRRYLYNTLVHLYLNEAVGIREHALSLSTVLTGIEDCVTEFHSHPKISPSCFVFWNVISFELADSGRFRLLEELYCSASMSSSTGGKKKCPWMNYWKKLTEMKFITSCHGEERPSAFWTSVAVKYGWFLLQRR